MNKTLWELVLRQNPLTGTLPNTICALNNTYFMALEFNYFTGTIPNCIGNMSYLEYLGLNSNNITGTIPSSISQLKFLKQLLLINLPYITGFLLVFVCLLACFVCLVCLLWFCINAAKFFR